MKRFVIPAIFGLSMCVLSSVGAEAAVCATNLRCEYLVNPLGVDVAKPRLSWILESDRRGERQTAYRVLIASSAAMLANDQADLWDSGRVESDATIHVAYAGKPLPSRTQCFWKVQVWDRNGTPSPWSEPAFWAMGLLDPVDWQAQWIGAIGDRKEPTEAERIGLDAEKSSNPPYAATLLRKGFVLANPPVRATLYTSGLGYCEVTINGRRASDRVLDPNFTDYTKRVSYTTDDVSGLLKAGQNAVGVVLGAGWYDTPAADVWKFHLAPWIAPPKLLLRLEVEYADGASDAFVTDATWKVSTGPIVFNSIRGGETYDARREKPGWDEAPYDDSSWSQAVVLPTPLGRLVSQRCPPIRVVESIRPVAFTEPKPGVFVFDFGVNIAGWAKINASGPAGQIVSLEYNEMLNGDGTVNMQHMADFTPGRFQTNRFVLKGEGIESFEPRFTYHGFRYVQVTGLSEKPTLDTLLGRWVHTDVRPAGEFSCSNPLLNTIHQMNIRTQLNNLHGIPTDCPQREKIGWTCDGCITMDEAICNFEMAAFYSKWHRDMLDAQDDNGHAACIVPSPGWGRSLPDGSPGILSDPWWGGAIVRLPWQLYRHYGDRRILEEGYPAMCRYLDYVEQHSADHITWAQEGDWLEVGSGGASQRTPPPLAGTAAYCMYAQIVAQVATILNKPDDARKYAELAESVRESFHRHFFNDATGRYADDSQTAAALALSFGIPSEEIRPIVAEQFLKNIENERNGHISSGIVGTFFVFSTLMDLGRDDLAYRMVTQKDFPGWGHMVEAGATTIWESWNGAGSHNHPALGCIDAWFYQALGGIRPNPEVPGFKTMILRPAIVGDLTWAKAQYDSIHGTIRSEWTRDNGHFRLHVRIPPNTTATVYVPTDRPDSVLEGATPAISAAGVTGRRVEGKAVVFSVDSGDYVFQSELGPH